MCSSANSGASWLRCSNRGSGNRICCDLNSLLRSWLPSGDKVLTVRDAVLAETMQCGMSWSRTCCLQHLRKYCRHACFAYLAKRFLVMANDGKLLNLLK